jgi:hypothetical protein
MTKKISAPSSSRSSRTADYAIQGFLYQFNKTLLSIIEASDDAEIVVEGLIEDIDIHDLLSTTAIQCKYHEGQEKFSLSLIYNPVLQMMNHFNKNSSQPIIYRIYCYCPDKVGEPSLQLTETDINTILSSSNKAFTTLISEVKGVIDVKAFIARFQVDFGMQLDELIALVHIRLADHGFDPDEVPALIYPNAIHTVATISIDHEVSRRHVRKTEFVGALSTMRKIIISRWTLSLKTKAQLLATKRADLKTNIAKNVRKRTFIIAQSALEDFDDGIVVFISDFLDKCHSKPAHTETPVFCLDCDDHAFSSIRRRIYEKGISCNDGLVGTEYVRDHFIRAPIVTRTRNQVSREFSIRLLRYEVDPEALNTPKCDDLFVVSPHAYGQLQLTDVNDERLATETLQQVQYLLGVSNVFE